MRRAAFESHHADVVLKNLNQDRKAAAKYCDFRIIAGDHSFPVHKSVIRTLSEFFDTMFSSETKKNL